MMELGIGNWELGIARPRAPRTGHVPHSTFPIPHFLFPILAITILATQCSADPYDLAMRRVRLLSNSQHVRLLPFGKSYEGRAIPAFVISDFAVKSGAKARVFVCAGQHGDERAPVEAVLSLCGRLASGARPDLLAKAVIIVAPIVNPDGFAARGRLNAQGIDINRDWRSLSTREASFVDRMIRTWKPHVVIDAHEWLEPTTTPGNEIEVPVCALHGQRQAMVDLAAKMEQRSGLAIVRNTTGANVALMHRRYSSMGYAAFLLETARGISQGAKQRAYSSAILASAAAVSAKALVRPTMSPSSKGFCLSLVAPYLEPLPPDPLPAPSGLTLALLVVGGYCLIVCVMKPLSRSTEAGWSRRFTKCSMDPEIDPAALSLRHAPYPITAKSWMKRRLRSRYAKPQPGVANGF